MVEECQGLCFGVSLLKYSHVWGSSVHSAVLGCQTTGLPCAGVPVEQGTCGQVWQRAGVAECQGTHVKGQCCAGIPVCWGARAPGNLCAGISVSGLSWCWDPCVLGCPCSGELGAGAPGIQGHPTPSLPCLPQDAIKPSKGMSWRTGVPAGAKSSPCKRGCMDAASFAVPWPEGTEGTSTGPFPVLRHQETFLVSQKLWEQQHCCSFPGVSTGHGLHLAMVTLSSTQVSSVSLCSVHFSAHRFFKP